MLVKSGYLDPTEAMLGVPSNNDAEVQDIKMERASQIFYDMMLNYNPEFLSP